MQREHQQAGFRSDREGGRREWDHGGRSEQHQMESREHARPAGKSLRTNQVRTAEADRQIREARSARSHY
jgi:hypothetical protein